MSDDDYDYEYDYDFFSEEDIADDIADHVDALAEHTLHSPVLVNAHPDFDLDYDELAYMTDEYYDGEETTTGTDGLEREDKDVKLGKRKRGLAEEGKTGQPQKKKKMERGEDLIPLVIWRKKTHDEQKKPAIKSKEGVPVALLPNWRELLGKKHQDLLTRKLETVNKQPMARQPASISKLEVSEKAGKPRRGKRPREASNSPISAETVKLGTRTRKVKKT